MCTLALLGCARNDKDELQARLSQWFDIVDARYFQSRMRCTAAVFRVESTDPKPSLAVQRDPDNARRAFDMGRIAAVQLNGRTPSDLTEAMLMNRDGRFGKQVLAAAAQSLPCLEDTAAEGALRAALTQEGALLAYDRVTEGLIVLNPVSAHLFYVAGDVW